MIKDIKSKINVDKRGKITTGIKAISEKTKKEYPKATDYFVIDDFAELIKSYGQKPNKLVLFFPSNEIIDFFDVNYVLYGGNQTKIRQCDGEECLHRIDEEIGGKKYTAGEISECVCQLLDEEDKKRCRPAMYLKAFIADKLSGSPLMPTCYLFYSGSKNTAENIYSELKKIRNLAGGNLIGIPFGLSVEMVSGREDAKLKFPIWNLQALGTLNQIKASIDSYLFNYKETLAINGQTKFLPAENNNFIPDSPQYWIEEINKINSVEEILKWQTQNKKNIDSFGSIDLEDINNAIENRISELSGNLFKK